MFIINSRIALWEKEEISIINKFGSNYELNRLEIEIYSRR